MRTALSGAKDLESGQPFYKNRGHGRFGTIERGHVLEKFGKHCSNQSISNK